MWTELWAVSPCCSSDDDSIVSLNQEQTTSSSTRTLSTTLNAAWQIQHRLQYRNQLTNLMEGK